MSAVRVERNGPVTTVILHRPHARNAVDGPTARALHTAGKDLSNAMREASRSLAGGSRQAITRKALVIAEVALSLILLAGSSVLLRRFVEMGRVSLGAPPEQILTLRVPLASRRYPDAARRITFFKDLLPRIERVPVRPNPAPMTWSVGAGISSRARLCPS